MGLKFPGSSGSPFLWISTVVARFHEEGTRPSRRHRLKISAVTRKAPSARRMWRYSSRSFPGAELDMRERRDEISRGVMGRTTSPDVSRAWAEMVNSWLAASLMEPLSTLREEKTPLKKSTSEASEPE